MRESGYFADKMIGALLPFCGIARTLGAEVKDRFVIKVLGIGCLRFFDDLIQLIRVFQKRTRSKDMVTERIMPMKCLHERAAECFKQRIVVNVAVAVNINIENARNGGLPEPIASLRACGGGVRS